VLLYLASSNPGKLREFRQAAVERGISVEPVPCFNDLPVCIEDGSTFEENARKKALYYSAHVQGLVFADDSGICVDALGGAPGIHSARFASLQLMQSESAGGGVLKDTTRQPSSRRSACASAPDPLPDRDEVNNQKLLRELARVPDERRTAHYVCVIALAKNGRVLNVTDGRVRGLITKSPRGSGGFGYDP